MNVILNLADAALMVFAKTQLVVSIATAKLDIGGMEVLVLVSKWVEREYFLISTPVFFA